MNHYLVVILIPDLVLYGLDVDFRANLFLKWGQAPSHTYTIRPSNTHHILILILILILIEFTYTYTYMYTYTYTYTYSYTYTYMYTYTYTYRYIYTYTCMST